MPRTFESLIDFLCSIACMWPAIEAEAKPRAKVETAFRVFDNRGNGQMTIEQFQLMLKGVGEPLPLHEYEAALHQARSLTSEAMNEEEGKECIDWEAYLNWLMPK